MKSASILQMTNEELVLHLQLDAANEIYCELLCKRFEPLFKRTATRWFVDGFSFDDYIQEGRIALLEAAQSFDPCTNRYFAPLVARTLEFRMSNLVRKRHAKKRGAGQKELPLGGYHTSEELSIICEENAAFTSLYPEDIVAVQELHAAYFDRLSTLERAVHYVHQVLGYSVEETANALSVSTSSIRSASDRCRFKLAQVLAEDQSNS